MKHRTGHTPPKWANRLLEWYCRPELLEDLQGDLHEYFDRNLASKGPKSARINFVMDVFKFMRPYTIKKLEILTHLTTIAMFKNYFKTSLRSIARNKLFSAINIIGLAISMSVCLLMITLINETLSFDKFHKDYDRIYRVITDYQFLQEDPNNFASTSILAGKKAQEEVPGLEGAVTIVYGFSEDAQIGDRVIPIEGRYASEDFFKVFSFNLLRGNPATVLMEPNSILLTDETARKLFADEDAMGQIIPTKSGKDLKVTGIVEKPPHNSHFKFESLVSFSTYESEQKKTPEENYWMLWSNIWSNHVYIKLAETTTADQVNARLRLINDEENEGAERVKIDTKLQPLSNIILNSDLSNSIGDVVGIDMLMIFGGLTLIVILSAGFNYTNLSIARSLRRAREVGVRKVVGASRGHIFAQFIVEAIVIALVALVISFFLYQLIKPQFLNVNPEIQQVLRLNTEPSLYLYFIVFAIMVGIMAGAFPALLLSKLNAVNALKNSGSTKLFSKVAMRKVLIVIQFTLSLAFIISASIGATQYKYALAFDLGFNTENVLNVRVQDNDVEALENAFSQVPEVIDITKSTLVVSTGSTYFSNIKFEDPMDSTTMYYNGVDEHYIPFMKHDLIAGQNFSGKAPEKETEIILNEQTLKRFNIGTPQEAIDKYVTVNDKKLRIIGVVRDFHYGKIENGIEQFGFRHNSQQYYIINLKVASQDMLATMDKIEAAWKEVDDVHPFQAQFYDEKIEQAYADFSILYTVVGFLAFITISIAVLGLLGMAVYTAETKLKEISIRKVLGATERSLINLLTKGFIWLLVISTAIAIPATYLLFDSLILIEMVNRAPISFIDLFSGVVFIFAVGFLTIGSQIWKAAKSNPAQTLRSE